MRPEASALVADAIRALDLVGQFIAGKPIADYEADVLVKSAVERQLHIAGEALADL